MKSAREMFEELGYVIDEENEKEILYKMKWEIVSIYWVSFNKVDKLFECFETSDSPFEPSKSYKIDIDLLKAINKQIEELGWKIIEHNQIFEFPPKQELKLKLKDMLEDEADEKYYLSDKQLNYVLDMKDVELKSGRDINDRIVNPQIAKTISCRGAVDQRADVTNFTIDNCNEELKVKDIKEYTNFYIVPRGSDGKLINGSYNRVWKTDKYVGALNLTKITEIGKIAQEKLKIRKLTPKECWRLMGFDDEDFEKASRVNSNTQLYKQAGNSICVPVLEAILKELIK